MKELDNGGPALAFSFPFYTLTKQLIQVYFKYKTVIISKLKIFFIVKNNTHN